MLIPNVFQCLEVVHQSPLGAIGCIRSLLVAPCEYDCAQWLLNYQVSTWRNRVTSLSPRTGVYFLCTLLFGCMECSGCIRVQPSFFADNIITPRSSDKGMQILYCESLYHKAHTHNLTFLPQSLFQSTPFLSFHHLSNHFYTYVL